MATSAIIAIERSLAINAPHLTKAITTPTFLYGTAWKKEATEDLVYRALTSGFTGIDTAAQPKHYREDLVGAGLRRALADGKLKRENVYLQTKYTSISGQDPNNLPYDSKVSITEQVRSSVGSSLQHLKATDDATDSYIDAVVLHSPLPTIDDTMEAWHTLENYVPTKIRCLGVSNCNLFTLMDICERANIKPSVVQNRFYPSTKFDIGLRKSAGKIPSSTKVSGLSLQIPPWFGLKRWAS